MSMLDEIRFWAQVIGDAKRTVFCHPEDEARIRQAVERDGLSGVVTVHVSQFIPPPPGTFYVFDEPGIRADTNQAFLRAARDPFNWRTP